MDNRNHLVLSKKPYQDFHFRCYIPKDLKDIFPQESFRISLQRYSYSDCKVISSSLYETTQSIFEKVRKGQMNEITIHDVKDILKDKVKQTYKHIHHYANDTNKWEII